MFRRRAATCFLLLFVSGMTAIPAAQTPSSAGTAKGFIRVNGKMLTLGYAVAVTAPDGFDPSKEVRLVLVTPTPIAPDALSKAASRQDIFRLVPAGAVVEVEQNGHTVFLRHAVLGDDRLNTHGDPRIKTTESRVSGTVNTFMSGDEDSFGFKVRFEITFDAPIAKRLPLGKATTAAAPPAKATTAAAPPAKVPAGPLPKTREEAVKFLDRLGLPSRPPTTDALVMYLTLGDKPSADVVRAYVLTGAAVNQPGFAGASALTVAVASCATQPAAPQIVQVLLDAGANANQKETTGLKGTPAMTAVFCPDVLPLILARKPDLNAVDANGLTVMHYAIRYGKPQAAITRMVKDAGFDMARWKASLLKEASGDEDRRLIEALSGNAVPLPAGPGRPPAAAVPPTSATAPRAGALDWNALGPYPSRSRTEAARLLARPGATTTADEHFWDGITSREPQRLAVALQAGANVKQTREVTRYTPLVLMAERCNLTSDVDAQVSIADQLIAAGADLTGLDANKANTLTMAAHKCPIGVVRALIKAGVPLNAVAANGTTALKAAIFAGRVDVVDALLDAGLDPKKEPYNAGRLASGKKDIEAALKKKRK